MKKKEKKEKITDEMVDTQDIMALNLERTFKSDDNFLSKIDPTESTITFQQTKNTEIYKAYACCKDDEFLCMLVYGYVVEKYSEDQFAIDLKGNKYVDIDTSHQWQKTIKALCQKGDGLVNTSGNFLYPGRDDKLKFKRTKTDVKNYGNPSVLDKKNQPFNFDDLNIGDFVAVDFVLEIYNSKINEDVTGGKLVWTSVQRLEESTNSDMSPPQKKLKMTPKKERKFQEDV